MEVNQCPRSEYEFISQSHAADQRGIPSVAATDRSRALWPRLVDSDAIGSVIH